jgi:AAA15 family ATPase/GTPase
MENFIDHINISNFKSIRNLKIEGLSRINLLIGKPNVGKSNILEAFGVFSLPYLTLGSEKKISSLIRLKNINEMFFDGITENSISIKTNKTSCICSLSKDRVEKISFNGYSCNILIHEQNSNYFLELDSSLKISFKTDNLIFPLLKNYTFKLDIKGRKANLPFLQPPFGNNILSAIEDNPTLKQDILKLFEDYNLKLVFDKASQELKIMKPQKGNEIFLVPYNSVADTLQRIIFYKTAIVTNKNSVLIFEEPEAHAFPPYIVHITQEIIDAQSNQFILSTHSPYVLDYFLENAFDETSIFMVDYKNGETVSNKLSKEDMSDILKYGIDLFTNYETFLK